MSSQTAHVNRQEAIESAARLAEGCEIYRMAVVWLAGPGRYLATQYKPGDEHLAGALLIVFADGTDMDAWMYANRHYLQNHDARSQRRPSVASSRAGDTQATVI